MSILLEAISVFEELLDRYRFQCRSCTCKGRWRVSLNDARADGERHHLRRSHGHKCDVFNLKGSYVSPCH